MKQIKILVFFIFINLYACAGYEKSKTFKDADKIYYSSNGFALIYEDALYEDKTINKKINNDEIIVLHSTLKKNTPVRITNLNNSKYIDSKIYKKANYPKIFNALISKKIASMLELDDENPLVEIIELKKNVTFVAGDSNTFDEERNVADKAPVDDIQIKEIGKDSKNKKKTKRKKFNYILKIADFYFEKSANQMKSRISDETSIKKVYIDKLSATKFRVFLGPFGNLNSLKKSFNAVNILEFDTIEFIKE